MYKDFGGSYFLPVMDKPHHYREIVPDENGNVYTPSGRGRVSRWDDQVLDPKGAGWVNTFFTVPFYVLSSGEIIFHEPPSFIPSYSYVYLGEGMTKLYIPYIPEQDMYVVFYNHTLLGLPPTFDPPLTLWGNEWFVSPCLWRLGEVVDKLPAIEGIKFSFSHSLGRVVMK